MIPKGNLPIRRVYILLEVGSENANVRRAESGKQTIPHPCFGIRFPSLVNEVLGLLGHIDRQPRIKEAPHLVVGFGENNSPEIDLVDARVRLALPKSALHFDSLVVTDRQSGVNVIVDLPLRGVLQLPSVELFKERALFWGALRYLCGHPLEQDVAWSG